MSPAGKAKARIAARLATGAFEVLLPLGLLGWGAHAAWGLAWACLVVGGLLWLRYMADVVRRA